MKRKFAGAGAWPEPNEKVVTNADVSALQQETPTVFRTTLEGIAMRRMMHDLTLEAFPDFRAEPGMTEIEVSVAMFKKWQAFARELDEALKAAPEVRDE